MKTKKNAKKPASSSVGNGKPGYSSRTLLLASVAVAAAAIAAGRTILLRRHEADGGSGERPKVSQILN